MHAYFLVRGKNAMVEDWKALMQGQSFKWKRKNLKTGKYETTLVQGGLRPIQLYEYVFPEESLSDVLWNTGASKGYGSSKGLVKAFAWLFRLGTGCKKVKKVKLDKQALKEIPLRIMTAPGVEASCIGIKPDKRRKWKEVGYEQEML